MPKLQSNALKTSLKNIARNEAGTIRCAVAEEALNYENPRGFFNDLLQHGCISGMVGGLIYYTDTHAFYDAHYDAIESIRLNFEDQLGQSIAITSDLKNFMAWFAFEQTAHLMAIELNILE